MEGGFAKCTFANVFVAVEVGTKGTFRVVGVDYLDFGEAKDLLGGCEGLFQAFGSCNVKTGSEEMARIEAVTEGKRGFTRREVADHAEFFETGPDLITGAYGV